MVLFLSDVSGSEIFVILFFILIFFGSKSIPGIARSFGRTIHQIKSASQDLQDEIKKSGADMRKDLNLDQFLQQTTREIEKPMEEVADELNDSVRYQRSTYFNRQQAITDAEVETPQDQPNESPAEIKPEDPKV